MDITAHKRLQSDFQSKWLSRKQTKKLSLNPLSAYLSVYQLFIFLLTLYLSLIFYLFICLSLCVSLCMSFFLPFPQPFSYLWLLISATYSFCLILPLLIFSIPSLYLSPLFPPYFLLLTLGANKCHQFLQYFILF